MKSILIVDDNITSLTSARLLLVDQYKVTAVKSGADALKFLEGHTVDLILLDINMPEMDGFEVMSKIRENESCAKIPIIFLTANDDAETESKCLEMGAVDFIAKPFMPNVMRSRISRVLESEERNKALANELEQKMQEVTDIKSRSFKDALTGLWNRAYTEKQVDLWLMGTPNGALMMLDMDNFKAINDNYGHIMGDQTLKMLAQTLQSYATDDDILCRIGGDEFMVFIRNYKEKQELADRAANIIADINRKLDECHFETNSSVSIGIALAPEDGADFTTLYNSADKALYYSKRNGKSAYHFYGEKCERDNRQSSNLVDLNFLLDIMSRTDSQKGAYMMDIDSFQQVYNFIQRFVERGKHNAPIILFTLNTKKGLPDEADEIETAMEMLDQAIFTSLRRADISTRYSSRQIVVILTDAQEGSLGIIINRIFDCFYRLYIGGRITVEYEIAQLGNA